MLADISAQVTSDGQTLTSNGTVHATQLQAGGWWFSFASPVDIATPSTTTWRAEAARSMISAPHRRCDRACQWDLCDQEAHRPHVALHLAAPNLPIDRWKRCCLHSGVPLPGGSRLEGGTLTANLSINGPPRADRQRPRSSGQHAVTGFDLSSKIGGLKPVSRSQGGTQIQTLRANVNSSSQGTRIDDLYAALRCSAPQPEPVPLLPAAELIFRWWPSSTPLRE